MADRRAEEDREEPAAAAPGRSLALLDALVRALPDLVWLKDLDGVYLACNARFEAFFGASEAAIIGRRDADFVPPGLAEAFLERDRAAVAAGHPLTNEEEVTFAVDGHRELLETVKTPLFDADGRLVGVLGIGRDITARKAAEKALSLHSHVLGSIASGAPLQSTLDELTRGVETQAPEMLAAVLLLDEDGRTLRQVSAPSLPIEVVTAIEPLTVGEGSGASGTAAFRQAPVIVEDVTTDPLFEPFREQAVAHGLRACWSTPILSGEKKVLGTLALYFPQPARPTLEQRRLVELAVDAAAIAITREREERALRESEARYRLVSEHGSDVIWLYDLAKERFTWASPSVERLRGFTVAEVLGQTLKDALSPESYREVQRMLPAALADFAARGETARARTIEVDLMRKDGSAVPSEVVTTLITDAEGRVTHIQGVSRDISERKRAAAALRAKDDLLREMSATAHIGGWAFDPATGQGAWTDEVARIHDVDPELGTTEAFGLSFYEGTSRERIERAVKDAVEQGAPYDLELELITPQGARKAVRTVGLPIVREGRVVQVRGTIQDVTERVRTEAARRETEEKLRLLIENAPAAIAMLDREMRYVFVSRRWLQDYRLGSRNIVGLSHYDVFPEMPDRWKEVHRRCLAGATESCDEDPFPRLDGSLDWVKWEVRPWYDATCAVGGLIVLSEVVTARKEADEARARLQEQLLQSQKMESIGRLAGGVAHDFNNMLAVIEGHATLALGQVVATSPIRSDLVEIRKAARRSVDLTRQLLAFARRQTAAPRPLDLNETVASMRAMLARLIGEDIDLSFRPGEELWPVRIDPAQVDQLLANLCVNARDAIAGVGLVTVETRNVTFDEAFCAAHSGFVPGASVMLSVSDDGSGMEKEVRKHLFEPFYTTKGVGRGTGLGLATVYGIVQQNGGFIDVETEPGRGSSFRIYLPRFEGSVSESVEAPEEDTPLGAGETVLLIEDEGAMLLLGEAMLRQLGYRVLAAASPDAALELARESRGRIDLLLTDVVMPGMNGRELANRIRAFIPALPCLFMSGYPADVMTHRGLLDEGVRLLPKPFSPHELAIQVRQSLHGRGAPGTKRDAAKRILFVDDEEALVALMRRTLQPFGYETTAYSDPIAALEAFRAAPDSFDAVVTDLAMPRLPGLDLIRLLIEARPGTLVIATSGYVSEGAEAAALSAGARALVLKPGTVEEFGRALDSVLKGA